MKLISARVRMFRNIVDSSEVAIEADTTCLVGKNESGKTAFLQALWRLNPARVKATFSVPQDYPAWLEKLHRREGRILEEWTPVTATFALEDSDCAAVDPTFGESVVRPGELLTLSRLYNNETRLMLSCNEAQAVQNFINVREVPRGSSKSLRSAKTFRELATLITTEIARRTPEPDATDALTSLQQSLASLLGSGDFLGALSELLFRRIPQFFYFAEYSKLPYSVSINHVLTDEDLNEAETTARALLQLGGGEEDYLLNPDFELRKRELENVANALTGDVLKYWSQNNQLRVQPEITQRTEQRHDGQHAVLDELKVRIWDNRHSLSLPFDQHSAGFQWFFSFLAAFSEYENINPPVIILLDEPAVGLHAKAQADFLKFIQERLTKRCQVVYTTHSPFMIEPSHLERVRVVEDRGQEEGSVVTTDVLSRDADTLFPLQGALGYDLVQHLFVAEHNLVVEGTSDYTYLKVISDYLAGMGGRVSLDPRWSIVPVGGADSIPTFVALLGNHLHVTVLVDSRKEGHQRLERLSSSGILAKQRIVLVGGLIGRKAADIEDLFDLPEYLDLYNRAFGSKLTAAQLTGSDPVVSRIARHIGVERYDHGKPADVILRERDRILPKLSDETLLRFESLFQRINSTLP